MTLIGVSGAVVTTVSDAHAQDADALTEARAKFQRAIELEQGQDWAGALKLFRQVGQVKMTAQVRYHIATCEEKLGQLVAALGGYELSLAQSEGMHPDFIQEVQASIDDLKSRIPKLVLERGEGAEAAAIELDGVALGASSIGIETPLDPGPHTVTATAPGFEPFRETITVTEGGVETLSVVLSETAQEPEYVPPPPVEAPPPPPKKYGMLPYIIGGSGAAVALTGGTFLILASVKQGKAKKLCGGTLDCRGKPSDIQREVHRLSNSAGTMEVVGFVSLGVGIAGVATGVVLYYLDNRGKFATTGDRGEHSRETATFRLSPTAPESELGFSLTGSF